MTVDWNRVRDELLSLCARVDDEVVLSLSQKGSVRWLADRLGHGGAVLADEVGLGKTRIACAVAVAVVHAGGRVAVVGPRRIAHQWKAQMERIPLTQAAGFQIIGSMPELLDEYARAVPTEVDAPRSPAAAILEDGPGDLIYVPDSFAMSTMPKPNRSGPWYVALPSVLGVALAEGDKQATLARNTRLGRLQAAITDDDRGSVNCITGGRRHLRGLAALAHGLRRRKRIPSKWRSRLAPPFQPVRTDIIEPSWAKSYVDDVRGHRFTEEIIGEWFGRFDLVIVDEAHRAPVLLQPADDATTPTRLQWVLDRLVALEDGGRRLCLTATPMALGTRDWCALLERATGSCPPIAPALDEFADAVRMVGRSMAESGVVERFERAAAAYTDALAPYVTRRRRIDEGLHVRLCDVPSLSGRNYRHMLSVDVDLMMADGIWRRVLTAAEGLSAVLRGTEGLLEELSPFIDVAAKDALGRLIVQCQSLHREVAVGWVRDDSSSIGSELDAIINRLERAAASGPATAFLRRAAWWASVLTNALGQAEAERRPHPRLLTAVRTIEEHTLNQDPFDGEFGKVLVFGFNTRPLRELVKLLNARDVLRRLAEGRLLSATLGGQTTETDHTPEGGRHAPIDRVDLSDLEIARATLTAPVIEQRLADLPSLKEALAEKAREYDNARDRTVRRVEALLAARREEDWAGRSATLRVLVDGQETRRVARIIAAEIVDKAIGRRWSVDDLDAMLTGRERDGVVHADELLVAEVDSALLVMADEIERTRATNTKLSVGEWLDEHTSVEGQRRTAYARLLDGGTPPGSLPTIQTRFNRREGALQVLVANSEVGQVGLDLHQACRVVFQLQLDWNPGDVEQQIGRVDRMGSRWQRCVEAWLEGPRELNAAAVPKIVVQQLVTRGAYDEYQFDVLRDRREVFEGALFDIVVHENVDPTNVDRLRRAVPDFSPSRTRVRQGDVRAGAGGVERRPEHALAASRSIDHQEESG
jgi:hypothetical protein